MKITYTSRDGESVVAGPVFLAYSRGSLKDMLEVLHLKTHPVDRHFLLFAIIRETYKLRDQPAMRTKCIEIAKLHIKEFPSIAPYLRDETNGWLTRVPTFQQYATVLTEDGDYQAAIGVCETAISLGLRDGTKSGYAGRISRIKKKMAKARKN